MIAGGEKLLGPRQIRLLRKALYAPHRNITARYHRAVYARTLLNVAVARLRTGRRYSQNHNPVPAGCQGYSGPHHLDKPLYIAYDMVGGKDAEHNIRRASHQQKRRQSARRSSIARGWFTQNMIWRHLRQLLLDRLLQQVIRDHPHVVRRAERQKTIQSLLNHGAHPIERQYLFRTSATAAGPESRPAAARQNYRRKLHSSPIISQRHRPPDKRISEQRGTHSAAPFMANTAVCIRIAISRKKPRCSM